MNKTDKIYVAGHTGLVGSAIMRSLRAQGYSNFMLHTIEELDLTRQAAVEEMFKQERPDYVILAAAKVGGIHANDTYPADFIYINLQLESNIIHSAYRNGVKKLCFLGSSCIYPKFAPQPMKEDYLLEGKLEPTNEPYAIAKIAGIKMCQAFNRQYGTKFISVMPTNLYGPHDNFDLQSSHVMPALIRKFVDARTAAAASATVWGSGSPKREFLFVDDLADAIVFLMNHYDDGEIINIGTGQDVTILELAAMIKEEVGFIGTIEFDSSKPDGTPRKLLDVSKINALGWSAKTPLREGVQKTIQWYLENK
ncbi:MAG: GDP-L-fucose synthase [Ignavibacteriae bacterium]|nr:MAG: GDP-L-fucose synthase [Ignavibacteriota bacterium]